MVVDEVTEIDIINVADDIVPSQIATFKSQNEIDIVEGIRKCVDLSINSYVIKNDDDKPVAIFGVVKPSALSEHNMIWTTITNRLIEDHSFSTASFAKRWVKTLGEVSCLINSDDVTSVRFAKWLGFNLSPLQSNIGANYLIGTYNYG